MGPALDNYMHQSGALAFSRATFQSLVVVDSITAVTRTAILALLALLAFSIDRTLNVSALLSLGGAILSFVVLDQMLVDRLLEPALEAFRFRKLLEACAKSIELCEAIAANPQLLAARLDGVILSVSTSNEIPDA